jgi:hypothetical protein
MSTRQMDQSGRGGPRPVHICGEEIPHAGHICAFFDSRAQKYQVLAPYLAEGIANGDRIINVVDAKDRDLHLHSLSASNVPIDSAIERGQYQLLTAEETYLREGAVNLDGMLELLREALESAERDGNCIRTCGEMNWIGRSSMPAEEVMSYEARVNEFVPTFQCTLVCVYDLVTLPSGIVADILATHPTAIINGQLRKNPVYVEPTDFLEMLQQRKTLLGDRSMDLPISPAPRRQEPR